MTLPESPKSKAQSPAERSCHTHLCILFAAAGSGGQNPPESLDTPHIIDTGGNTKTSITKPLRPGQPERAKYRLSNTLRKMFFENKTS